MNDSDEFFEVLAYVRASRHRSNIIKFLAHGLKTPKEIGVELDIRTNHVSNLLADLKKKDLVFCLTPNVHKGRLYKLTDVGCKISEYLGDV